MSNTYAKKMRQLFKSDYRRHLEVNQHPEADPPGLFGSIRLILKSPGILAVLFQRLDQLCYSWRSAQPHHPMANYLRMALILLNYLKRTIYKIAIPNYLSIGPGLVISGRGKIIAGAIQIGKNCTLHPRVTIGIGGMNRDKPIIGDNVLVESDALIFGGIRIGNNVTIKSGTVCSKNIPDNCIVEGNPARIVHRR